MSASSFAMRLRVLPDPSSNLLQRAALVFIFFSFFSFFAFAFSARFRLRDALFAAASCAAASAAAFTEPAAALGPVSEVESLLSLIDRGTRRAHARVEGHTAGLRARPTWRLRQ